MFRTVLRRQPGTVGITDLLLVVLVADAAQNAMSNDYKSIPDGLLLVATIIFWSYALDWLAYRVAWIRRLVEPAPLLLIKDGQMMRKHMRQELITPDELMSQLREHGVDDISEVKKAYIESDGHISVVKRDKELQEMPKRSVV